MLLFGVVLFLVQRDTQSLIFNASSVAGSQSLVNKVEQKRNVAASVPMVVVESSLILPLADDNVLMGSSHDVFVGKVIAKIGTREEILGDGVALPISQFSVEPIWNIKGNLQSRVVVEQLGGYQNGVLVVGDSDGELGPHGGPGHGYLLQPGLTYVLSTRYESVGVYYLWDFPTASQLVTSDSNLSHEQLQMLSANNGRVQQLEAAYPNEVIPADDVRNHRAFNSYSSLTAADKAALPYQIQ